MGLELGADDYVTKPSARASCWRAYAPCFAVATPRSGRADPRIRAYRFDGWN